MSALKTQLSHSVLVALVIGSEIGGTRFLFLSALRHVSETWLNLYPRREHKARIFTRAERLVFSILSVAAIAALIALLTGKLAI